MKFFTNIFEKIICLENLFTAWDEFKSDKSKKVDVLEFEQKLEQNIFCLHRDLKYHRYKHGVYTTFTICDPKQRKIHKALVRDRILHHAIFRVLNPIFEPSFISHSFSCRINKGTHRGVNALDRMINTVSKNKRKRCWVLKCDIKKFFDSVDQVILLEIIKRKIKDNHSIWLIDNIIKSFPNRSQIERERERE
jgi:retron-type reverse transcriptase